MSGAVSVIIPVYNVEKYLSQCLDSVLSQSYSSLQVIVIDDGSTDSSGTICDEYAAKDSRVVVIHQKNGGAAAAKNAGLRIATGNYLSFVDSDDYLEPDAYRHMVSALEEADADVIQCAFRDVYPVKTVPHYVQAPLGVSSAVQYLEYFTKDWTCGLMTDKLFVRELFCDVWFEEGHRIDDEYFTYRGIMNAGKILRDDFLIYNYRKRRSSVMQSPDSAQQIVKDRIDYLSKRRKLVTARFPELREAYDRHFIEAMVILSRDPDGTKESSRWIRKQLQEYFREKQHTPVDFRLWPAVLKMELGLIKKQGITEGAESTSLTEQYFD